MISLNTMRKWFAVLEAILALAFRPSGSVVHTQLPQGQSSGLQGIYVYSSNVATISAGYGQTVTQSLQVSGVDGIVLVIGWNAIEPMMGQYQWTTLDGWISQAVASGKKIDLTIVAGVDSPAWLFEPAPNGAGATGLNFTVSPHSGATGVCD